MTAYRTESDSLGSFRIPQDALYSVHTSHAVANFPIFGIPLSTYPELVRAMVYVMNGGAILGHGSGGVVRSRAA